MVVLVNRMVMPMLSMVMKCAPCMVMSVMVVSGRSLVIFVSGHQKTPASDAIPVSSLESAVRKIYSQIVKRLVEYLLGHSEIPECANGHVAAYSGKCIDMKEFHDG